MHLPNPVIRSHYRSGFIKQHVRDHLILRIEAATNNVTDYGVNKAVENLPALRTKLASINDNYLDIQQDILETFVDRGQLQHLAQPTYTSSGKRIPGLKLDNLLRGKQDEKRASIGMRKCRRMRDVARKPSQPRQFGFVSALHIDH